MSDVWRSHRSLLVQRGSEEDCPGMLVIVDRSDSLVTVECNGCEYAGCVPTREMVERPEREATW